LSRLRYITYKMPPGLCKEAVFRLNGHTTISFTTSQATSSVYGFTNVMFLRHDGRLAVTWPEAIHMTDDLFSQICQQVVTYMNEYQMTLDDFMLEDTILPDSQQTLDTQEMFDFQATTPYV
jgi:hypothetical protein